MKGLILMSSLATAVTSSAIPAESFDKRQLGGLVSAFMGKGIAPTVMKTLKAEYDPKATRAVYMYGPFVLPPSNFKHAATGFSTSGIKLDPNSDTPGGTIAPPCQDCTVLKAVANFAFKNGTEADTAHGIYTHHIIVADFGGKSQLSMPVNPPKCINGAVISPMPPMSGMGPKASPATGAAAPAGGMAGMSHGAAPAAPAGGMAGMTHGAAPAAPKAAAPTGGMAGMSHGHSRRSSVPLQKRQGVSVFIGGGGSVGSGNPFAPKPGSNVKSGYWIGKSGPMQLTSEIVNYDPVEKEIYLTLDVEWVPGKATDLLDVGMGALSADRCEDKEKGIVHPPKDKAVTYKGEEWPVESDGYMVNFTPHIHDGGTKVNVFLNGKQICESRAVYGAESKALDGKGWQTIVDYTPCNDAIAIKKGDKIYVSAEYDLTKYRLRPDNQHSDAEAEGMVLVNFIWARPFSKGWFGK